MFTLYWSTIQELNHSYWDWIWFQRARVSHKIVLFCAMFRMQHKTVPFLIGQSEGCSYNSLTEFDVSHSTILVKILGTSHKIALLQSFIQCPPLPPFQCWLNQTPFDHPNIELGGEGGREGSKRMFSRRYFRKHDENTEICQCPNLF